MACKVAENKPLDQLRAHLDLERTCHSARPGCIHGLSQSRDAAGAFGIGGAVLGYCQALFNRVGEPAEHTSRVLSLLSEAGLPWAQSHELFWGFRQYETAAEYLGRGMQPLLGSGRIPILISALDAAADAAELDHILNSHPPVHEGETLLVRMVLGSPDSFDAVGRLIGKCYSRAVSERRMPRIWPLLQASGDFANWDLLRLSLGSLWRFVNLAVNPFVDAAFIDRFGGQVTVAQVAVGDLAGIGADGQISLPAQMRVAGAGRSYAVFEYIRQLSRLEVSPTLILLGPSLPEWSEQVNVERIARMVGLVRTACDELWADMPAARREWLWRLSA